MHLKRNKTPKNWPVARKGTKYVVRPSSSIKEGIPLLIVIRDMLKIAKNRKEVKKAIHDQNILINDKIAREEKKSICLFDKVVIVPAKKYYRLNLSEFGKFSLEEIKETESHQKISKIINKKILKGKKIQLNLVDGRNYFTDLKCKVNDSVVVDFKENKIKECLSLKEKENVVIFAGKHAGKRGKINKIDKESKMAEISVKDGKINVLIKQFMVTK